MNKIELDKFIFYNEDNLNVMKTFKDKEFDLAIVDPPYGIDITKNLTKENNGNKSFMGHSKKIIQGKHWDKGIPDEEYFTDLMRISKNQIIWGGNYFLDYLGNTRCFCIWDKMNGTNDMADAEIAWTSFGSNVRMFRMHHFSKGYEDKIHPTQKPTKLYEWILQNYATEGMKIIDTHLGSGSIAIAIDKANTLDKKNLQFVGIELDPDYFMAAINRFKTHKLQKTLF